MAGNLALRLMLLGVNRFPTIVVLYRVWKVIGWMPHKLAAEEVVLSERQVLRYRWHRGCQGHNAMCGNVEYRLHDD